MSSAIHDWNDAEAVAILRNCRRAVPDDGVLVLIEYCLGEANTPSVGKMVDLVMLTITGGRERTVEEHRALLASAGFALTRAIPISTEIMIVEALPSAAGEVSRWTSAPVAAIQINDFPQRRCASHEGDGAPAAQGSTD